MNLMKEYEFKILHKKRNDIFSTGKFNNIYNYVFKDSLYFRGVLLPGAPNPVCLIN